MTPQAQDAQPRPITVRGQSFSIDNRFFPKWWDKVEAGDWEPTTFQAFEACVRPGTIVVDVGAWVGATVLYAAALGARVETFEPDPEALRRLRANLDLNPALAQRITVHTAAMGITDGEAKLYNNQPGNSGSSLVSHFGYTDEGHQAAFTTTAVADGVRALEAMAGEVSLIKIDIEGGEYDLIPHLAGWLAGNRPSLHLSFHPFNIGDGDMEKADLIALRASRTEALAAALPDYAHIYSESADGFTELTEPLLKRAARRPFLRGGWLFSDTVLPS